MLDGARGLLEALPLEAMGKGVQATLRDLLELTAQPVRQLLALAVAGPRSPLPQTAVALLQRAHLSTSALTAYTLRASRAALVLVRGEPGVCARLMLMLQQWAVDSAAVTGVSAAGAAALKRGCGSCQFLPHQPAHHMQLPTATQSAEQTTPLPA